MEDIKAIVADNVTELRRDNGMTQAELAEKLNYSDKAVSKWERAESLPDIAVLKQIAELFGVSVDYLLEANHPDPALPLVERMRRKQSRVLITGMSMLLVWLLATAAFVVLGYCFPDTYRYWLFFIYAVPLSITVWLVMNSVWFGGRRNFYIVSALMWSLLCAVHLSLLTFGINIPLLYVLGAPGEAIIMLGSRMTAAKSLLEKRTRAARRRAEAQDAGEDRK